MRRGWGTDVWETGFAISYSQPPALRILKLDRINSRLTIPTFVEEEIEDELDWEGVAELFSRNFLLMFTELNFFGWDTFVAVVGAGPPFEVGVEDV